MNEITAIFFEMLERPPRVFFFYDVGNVSVLWNLTVLQNFSKAPNLYSHTYKK